MNKLLVSITIIIGMIVGTGCTFDTSKYDEWINKPVKAPTNLEVSKGEFANKIRVAFDPAVGYTGNHIMCYSTREYSSNDLKKIAIDYVQNRNLPENLECKELEDNEEFITNIQPKQTYHVWVAGISKKAEIAYDTGYSLGTPPNVTHFVANDKFSSTCITLRWYPIDVQKYRIYRTKDDGSYFSRRILSANNGQRNRWEDCEYLEHGKKYRYYIQGCNGDECSTPLYSEYVSLKPEKPKFSSTGLHEAIVVQFDYVEDPSFVVQVSESSNFAGAPEYKVNGMMYSDTTLKPDKTYYIRAKRYDKKLNRYSYWSDVVETTTKSAHP